MNEKKSIIEIPQIKVDAIINAAAEEAWFRGNLRHLCHEGQKPVYDGIHEYWSGIDIYDYGPITLNMHRGFGKSYLLALLCIESALNEPETADNSRFIRFGSASLKATLDFSKPNINRILQNCPEPLKPHVRDNVYTFHNPKWSNRNARSQLIHVSFREEGEKLRGPRTDLFVVDEAREIPKFKYVINDIVVPHFQTRKNPLLIISSTPPRLKSHEYWSHFVPESRKNKSYFCCTVEENPWADPEQSKVICKKVGGPTSTTWQREYLCKCVSDQGSLIIPEYTTCGGSKVFVRSEYERPDAFRPFNAIDFGGIDWTGLVWLYHDYEKDIVVIEDSIALLSPTIGEIAAVIKAKDKKLYEIQTVPGCYNKLRHIADSSKVELETLRRDHKLFIEAAIKHNLQESIAKLRDLFRFKRIIILDNNVELLSQLEECCWDARGNFERTVEHGHADLIAALYYAVRAITFTRPFEEVNGEPNILQQHNLRYKDANKKRLSFKPINLKNRRSI